MVKALDPNRVMIIHVAKQLEPLLEQFVFLGGCALGFLISDSSAPAPRMTVDVDVIVEIGSRTDYDHLKSQLYKLGLCEDGAPICRWRLGDVKVDIMPTDPEILGFSNRWYDAALYTAKMMVLTDDLRIRMISAPYFLATKLEAFLGRGEGDYYASHDLEDIIALVDGRPELVEEVRSSSLDLREYLAEKLTGLLQVPDFLSVISGHLPPDMASQARVEIVKGRLEELLGA